MVIPMSGKDFNEVPDPGIVEEHGSRRLLYPVKDAAFQLGISERKAWTLVDQGRLRTKWIDGRRLVPAEVLDEFVANLPTTKPETVAV
jgi:helix-turn-helix protein